MRIFLSSLILFVVTVGPVCAGPLNSCPGLNIEWVCVGGVPQLQAKRTERDVGLLEYFLTVDGSATGVEVAVHQKSVWLENGQSVDIVGLGAGRDGACCAARRAILPPATNFCEPVQEIDSASDVEAKEDLGSPTLRGGPPLDLAATVFVNDPCTRGAAGPLCRGAIQIEHVDGGPMVPIVPVTVTAVPSFDAELTVSGPANCVSMGAGAGFCQLGGTELRQISLSIALKAPPSFQTRQTDICVALSTPSNEKQTKILVQTALKRLGFDPGPLDGVDGAKSARALAAFFEQYRVQANTLSDPKLLEFLGLGSFGDANAENNRQCTKVVLEKTPRPKCDSNSTYLSGERCRCRYEGMKAVSATRCACPKGTRYVAGAGCRKTDRSEKPRAPIQCDPDTTVSTGSACVCRYQGMINISRARCGCSAGKTFYAGEGCL